ncbi:MAG: hypothetical protein DRN30_02280 [Thermoplasmata archaeon]|nr:MAG: hypothetical protein DRN30_02280 [Thermoplasmata archaeon]
MKDINRDLIVAFKAHLDDIAPVKTVVTNNNTEDFIYITKIDITESENKDKFIVVGTVILDLYSAENTYSGSISDLLTKYSSIKEALQPTKGYVLPLNHFQMVTWRLINSTGVQQILPTGKLFAGTLQYEFIAQQLD